LAVLPPTELGLSRFRTLPQLQRHSSWRSTRSAFHNAAKTAGRDNLDQPADTVRQIESEIPGAIDAGDRATIENHYETLLRIVAHP
jgi:hypothetical protein